ncbi:cation channel sperm-associated auxiliary subunit delta-like [Petaurus breviceps papuanus]|uniref:cation channel sperm-associated auxiliary subunit delta-like n=1 Tax=Petaurus breviceps papuanus TaxID=3040969 RepID=UPI0036D7E26E
MEEDSAMMFESRGNVLIITPKEDDFYKSYDFIICAVNIQNVLVSSGIVTKDCKAEVFHGNFGEKLYILDMGETLELSVMLVSRPTQVPIPINITLMQQHVSGRAHKNFLSDIKIPSLSTITLDLMDRGVGCIDLQPLSGLIFIGCNGGKKIIIRRTNQIPFSYDKSWKILEGSSHISTSVPGQL